MNKSISSRKMGIVSFKSTSHCGVVLDDQEYICQISRHVKLSQPEMNLNKKYQGTTRALENLIVVGDRVVVENDFGGQSIIIERMPRQNQLSRATSTRPGGQLFEQILVSNVDQIVAVFAIANPEPKWNLLDRYLVMAEAVDLPIWIVLTKMDLAESSQQQPEIQEVLDTYQHIGYPILFTSSLKKQGIYELMQILKNKNSVLIGKSGVGKTSLLNVLLPEADFQVNAVNAITGKGRHTTSAMRLLPIDANSSLIDSPGTREFGLWDIDPDDLDWYFREMRPYITQCKFKLDCRHEDEPGCAVRQAVVNGVINPRRYQSYLRLKEDFLL